LQFANVCNAVLLHDHSLARTTQKWSATVTN